MTSENTLERFEKYSESLTQSCIQHPKIIGLVLVGSTAETQRVDEWSDHDFFVITEDGEQEGLRQNLSWLPEPDSLAFWFRETEHGLKVVYKSGDVLEFAVFSCDELRGCMVNHHRLAYGNQDVIQALSGTATTALLKVFTRRLHADPRLDKLDVSRRFEFVHPEIGRAIAGALAQKPEAAAHDLLKISEKYLAPLWPDFPKREVDTVKDVFSWTS